MSGSRKGQDLSNALTTGRSGSSRVVVAAAVVVVVVVEVVVVIVLGVVVGFVR